MPTYITLITFTEKGAQAVKATSQRAAAFKTAAKKLGVTVKQSYWTLGAYDGVAILEAPDDETATAALVSLGSLGNVRTQTLRAFTAAEMDSILAKLP